MKSAGSGEESRRIDRSEGGMSEVGGVGGGAVGLSSNERFRPLSEVAPNPLLTPLHVGHHRDKVDNGGESPFSKIAPRCRGALAHITNKKKKGGRGSRHILGRKQFKFLDTAADEKLGHCRL